MFRKYLFIFLYNYNIIIMNNEQQNQQTGGKQVMNLDYLDREAQLYRESKDSIKENSNIIKEAVEKNTKREVEEVQNAINNLNKKMEQIMKTDFIKDKKEKIEKSQEQMMKSVENAIEAFYKVRKVIMCKDNLTSVQKREYEKKLYDKIIDKFMTKEEKEMFEKMLKGNQVIMMGNPYSGSSGISSLPMLGL